MYSRRLMTPMFSRNLGKPWFKKEQRTNKSCQLYQLPLKATPRLRSSYRCLIPLQTPRPRRVSSGRPAPPRLADDIIPTGPDSPQVLPVDGFDRQRDRGGHDTHTAVPLSPPAAVGPPHCGGAADRSVYTESRSHLQRVWSDLFSEKTGGRNVGWWMDGWENDLC